MGYLHWGWKILAQGRFQKAKQLFVWVEVGVRLRWLPSGEEKKMAGDSNKHHEIRPFFSAY